MEAVLATGEFIIKTGHKSLTHPSDQRLHTPWQQKALTKMMGLQYKIMYKMASTMVLLMPYQENQSPRINPLP
jgi:hypothetical protein